MSYPEDKLSMQATSDRNQDCKLRNFLRLHNKQITYVYLFLLNVEWIVIYNDKLMVKEQMFLSKNRFKNNKN